MIILSDGVKWYCAVLLASLPALSPSALLLFALAAKSLYPRLSLTGNNPAPQAPHASPPTVPFLQRPPVSWLEQNN